MADMICHKVYELLMSILKLYKYAIYRTPFNNILYQGVSYSQKFRVKRGFPNYLEIAISQFGSAKK
jgi:hypothetical protein